MSGGFPHSDILGSKPIPGSPWLNAGYHVLHRLLLPRHPPNALFALDLIQKEQGPVCISRQNNLSLAAALLEGGVSKACTFPPSASKDAPVSVLDLEQYRSTQPSQRMQHCQDPMSPLLGQHQTILMFLSINDVKVTFEEGDNVQLDGGTLNLSVRRSNCRSLANAKRLVEPIGIEPMTS